MVHLGWDMLPSATRYEFEYGKDAEVPVELTPRDLTDADGDDNPEPRLRHRQQVPHPLVGQRYGARLRAGRRGPSP